MKTAFIAAAAVFGAFAALRYYLITWLGERVVGAAACLLEELRDHELILGVEMMNGFKCPNTYLRVAVEAVFDDLQRPPDARRASIRVGRRRS